MIIRCRIYLQVVEMSDKPCNIRLTRIAPPTLSVFSVSNLYSAALEVRFPMIAVVSIKLTNSATS
jgi:hypothetical protein